MHVAPKVRFSVTPQDEIQRAASSLILEIPAVSIFFTPFFEIPVDFSLKIVYTDLGQYHYTAFPKQCQVFIADFRNIGTFSNQNTYNLANL